MRGHRGLLGLLALLLLAACSSGGEEAVTEQPTPPVQTEVAISFSGRESQEEAVERGSGESGASRASRASREPGASRAAGEPLNEVGRTTFTVWGYKNLSYDGGAYGEMQKVFPGYRVDWNNGSAATTTTNSNGWDYILTSKPEQTIKYWDFAAKAYRFFAVTGTGTNGAEETDGTYEVSILVNVTSTTYPYFSRLWFSTGNPTDYPDKQFGKPVTLEFVKPAARVRFLFNYVYAREGLIMGGRSFKPTDGSKIAREGTVTVHYPTVGTETKEWVTVEPSNNDAMDAFTEDYEENKSYTDTNIDNGWYTVLPNNAQGSYTLTVSINGAAKTAVVPAAYMKWLPGYEYTYIFKVNEEGGVEFGSAQYAVTGWTDTETDRTVYNW